METKERANTPVMNRRALLKATPAALLAGSVPAVAAEAESPVMALFREWLAHNDWLNGPATNGMPDDEFDARCQDDIKLIEAILCKPARDLSDMALKLLALTEMARSTVYPDLAGADLMVTEARALIGA